MCCSFDGSEVLQLRKPQTPSCTVVHHRAPSCTGARRDGLRCGRSAGFRAGQDANLLVIRSRFSTDTVPLKDRRVLQYRLPTDDRVCLTPASWAPDGDHVILWGKPAVCLRLSTRTCTVISPERPQGMCVAWSPDNVALMFHCEDDAEPNFDALTTWDPAMSLETSVMSSDAYNELTGPHTVDFVGYPTAMFVGEVAYIGHAPLNGLIEWDYRTGQHRFLGHTRAVPSLFCLGADGKSVVWETDAGAVSTAPGRRIASPHRPEVAGSVWHSPTPSPVHCRLLCQDPLVLSFDDSTPYIVRRRPLRVHAPVTDDVALLTEEYHPRWIEGTSAFVVPLCCTVVGSSRLLRVAFAKF